MLILQRQQRDVQTYVPGYVINHGVIKAGDLQHLLRRSKVLWDQYRMTLLQAMRMHAISVYFKSMIAHQKMCKLGLA